MIYGKQGRYSRNIIITACWEMTCTTVTFHTGGLRYGGVKKVHAMWRWNMLAVVKKLHTEFTIQGQIPEKYIRMLKNDFGSDLVIEEDDGEEECTDVTQTDWYKTMKKEETPGEILRFYRKLNGFTQLQLAEKLGITKQRVSNMEHNLKPVSRRMSYRLAGIFGIRAGRFMQDFIYTDGSHL
jgi:DNA-binding XRE family transcriptional regulator